MLALLIAPTAAQEWTVNDMRLGDLDALFYRLVNTNPKTPGKFSDGVAKALEFILNAPTIDAVPVVRCKDCQWFAEVDGKDSGKPCGYGQCNQPLGMRRIIFEDDFCSDGDRKEKEEVINNESGIIIN